MKRLCLFLLALIVVLSVGAQIRGNNIVVTVTPDHKDWNYRVGEKAGFTVDVRKSGTLLEHVKVDYEAGDVSRSEETECRFERWYHEVDGHDEASRFLSSESHSRCRRQEV